MRWILVCCLAVLLGCGGTVVVDGAPEGGDPSPGDDDDGDDGGDDDDDDDRARCGDTTCERGQVCCNDSCGICTGPDEGCVAIACD